jgi:hypothetical protein
VLREDHPEKLEVVVADTDQLVRREGVPSKTGVGPQARQLSCLTAAISEIICAPWELNDTWDLGVLEGVADVALDAPAPSEESSGPRGEGDSRMGFLDVPSMGSSGSFGGGAS